MTSPPDRTLSPALWPGWLWRVWWIDLYLGHGRALEAALVFVELQYALLWLFVPVQPFVVAFEDIEAPHWVFGIPFAIAAAISLVGMVLNGKGIYPIYCKWLRICGASMGMAIWIFILSKNILIGFYGAGVNPWLVVGIIGSMWIIRRSVLGLPLPLTEKV